MTNLMMRGILSFVFLFAGICIGSDKISLDPRSPLPAPGEQLEVEQIEIQKVGANPSVLNRKPGRFLLLIINRNDSNRDAAFVLDPASVGDGVLGANPLFQMGGLGLNDRKHRCATLFQAIVGEFDLKYADTGKVVCHFSIKTQ